MTWEEFSLSKSQIPHLQNDDNTACCINAQGVGESTTLHAESTHVSKFLLRK